MKEDVKQRVLADLQQYKYFKAIVGGAVHDPALICRQTLVYTLAGATAIDISPSPSSVRAAQQGVELAQQMSKSLGVVLDPAPPAIITSIGRPNDMHFLKATIDLTTCTHCGACVKMCPDFCITQDITVLTPLCRGCGWCVDVCPIDPKCISMVPIKSEDMPSVVKTCLDAGTDFVELHLSGASATEFRDILSRVKAYVPNDDFICVVLGSGIMSHVDIVERAKLLLEYHPKSRVIIQSDGAPMSNTDMPALDFADLILNTRELRGVWVQISGGINENTRQRAKFLGLKIHGVGIGIRSLEIVRDLLERPDFLQNYDAVRQATDVAGILVQAGRGQTIHPDVLPKVRHKARRWGASFQHVREA